MMFFRPLLALILASAALSTHADTPAVADPGRAMSQYLTHHGYGVLHVDNGGGDNHELLTANINGQWETLLVDTGCSLSSLSWYAARELGLTVMPTKEVAMAAGGLVKKNGIAVLKSFKLNNYEINRTNIIHVMSPEAHIGENGLFGLDYMRLNALILPVGATFVFFKPGATPMADIGPYMRAMGYKSVPLTYGNGGLRIEGTLDGHPYTAVVDSGNAYTFFDSDYIRKTDGAFPRSTRISEMGIDGQRMTGTVFNTRQLIVGSIPFGSIQTLAIEHSTIAQMKAQALLGYDLLAEHQAIVDLGHNLLWMQ